MRKKIENGQLAVVLDLITAKFVLSYLCGRHYILFYIHGPAILHLFSVKYHKILKIQNGH